MGNISRLFVESCLIKQNIISTLNAYSMYLTIGKILFNKKNVPTNWWVIKMMAQNLAFIGDINKF